MEAVVIQHQVRLKTLHGELYLFEQVKFNKCKQGRVF